MYNRNRFYACFNTICEEKSAKTISLSRRNKMGLKRQNPPCTRECENRHPGCHGKCEAWLAYEKARNEQYKATYERKEQARRTYIHAERFEK